MSKFIAEISKRCVACGSCIKVCPRGALIIKDGIIAIVDKELCVGCGMCVKACPAGIIKKVERRKNETN